ncbi:MAG: DUF1365 domain-containing protein [Rhodospirillales bacterium 20-64-7]|nr:MAG: DUF1365 domain-containing protein [Rhodospirillales bacterium 20-64-7]
MAALASLYAGRVTHLRHTPFRHRFGYRIWMLAIDLDAIDEVAASSRIFAHNRFALVSLADRDHGFRDGRDLRSFAQSALAREGLSEYAKKIVFVTMPRLLGYAFNPISFYYCYDAQGRLGAVLHQVKNTFGDQIGYVMPVHGEPGMIRQYAPKKMHVSPFFDMQGGYRFALTAPHENLTVSIAYGTAEQRRMTATMQLSARPFNDKSLLRLLAEMPAAPFKVIAAIHWQALRLWLRGAKFHAVPKQKHETIIAGEHR